MPRTPLAGPGHASTVFTGRTSVRRRHSATPSHGPNNWLRHLALALAALVAGVLAVVAWTVLGRLLPANDTQSVQSSRIPRREAVDVGLSFASSDYASDYASSDVPLPLSHGAAGEVEDASGVSLYTCAPGAPGFSWALTPSGALRSVDSSACVSFVDGDAAFLLTLVPCDSALVLSFSVHAPSGQVRAAFPAAGQADAAFCLDTGDANTQGAPLLLQPCRDESDTAQTESPHSQVWDHVQLEAGLLVSSQYGLCASAGSGPCGARGFCLSNALGSHMVLQRAPQAAVLWGFAAPGDAVDCLLVSTGQEARTVANAAGHWELALPPQPAGGPHDIVCSSQLRPDSGVSLQDVLFGDVYLCGGQSNMVFSTRAMFHGSEEVATADSFPDIRLFSVGQSTPRSPAPGVLLQQFGTLEQPWTRASAASVGGSATSAGFSAVCWVAGRTLHAQLGGTVPLGLVTSAWGGTTLQQWAPSDAVLRECGQSLGQGARFEAMIAPLLPLRLTGVLFYQGETNVGADSATACPGRGPETYSCLFPAVIAGWRTAFATPDLFFAFVQLSPYSPYACHRQAARLALPRLRASQLAALALPRTAMVTAIDLGDVDSPYRDVHPRVKVPIGERLAAVLAAQLYNVSGLAHRSPAFESAVLLQAQPYAVMVSFRADTCDGGLRAQPEPACPAALEADMCAGWELQAGDGSWYAASAAVAGPHSVTVTAPELPGAPVAVRYAYANFPLASLFSGEGWPALPLFVQL